MTDINAASKKRPLESSTPEPEKKRRKLEEQIVQGTSSSIANELDQLKVVEKL